MFTASCSTNGQAAVHPYRIETIFTGAVFTRACVQLGRKQQLQMSSAGAILRRTIGKNLCRIRAKKQNWSVA